MEQVAIKAFLHKYEAEMAKGLLDQAKIVSIILSDDCGEARASLSFGQTIKLMVRKEDLEKAKEVLKVIE